MLIIIGLIILVAALIIGVAGVLGNGGSTHPPSHGFVVLGYHVTGSAGTLFLVGIVVGASGLLGLSLLLIGARRTSRRGSSARRSLRESRRETAAVSQDRDNLIGERDTARAHMAGTLGNGEPQRRPEHDADARPRNGLKLLGRRFTLWQARASQPDPVIDQSDPSVAADPVAADEPTGSSARIPDSVSSE
jgi:hypothetical protein